MTAESPKVEFALGSEVSPGRFFKSAFARTFASSGNGSYRDCKSLDYELLPNAVLACVTEDADNNNGRFFSLNSNFANKPPTASGGSDGGGGGSGGGGGGDDDGVGVDDDDDDGGDDDAAARTAALQESQTQEAAQSASDANELEKLRKQCQLLKKENRRLQSAFLQNGFLQARVDTLQWQFKQVESNRQMYRSVMEQVAHFLSRAHKSLEILHGKESAKDKRRVPRSRSVHTVAHTADPSPSRASTSSPSPSGSSRFTRAKSVTHMSPSVNSIRDFTWSVLRRNDPVHCTSPRAKPPRDHGKANDDVVYQEPKQSELNPDEIPPEKLSQEAFRLLRIVDSLLVTREPDLARMTSIEDNRASPFPIDRHQYHDVSVSSSLQITGNFANSTTLQEAGHTACTGSDRGNESSGSIQGDGGLCFAKPSAITGINPCPRSSLPGARSSPDASSLNSGSSKTTEEEDVIVASSPKQLDRKKPRPACKAKSPVSVSSAESESGFSSISSFQEVGLPSASTITPVKGCHTEVGLPEVPLDKASRRRRWTSTPAELQALYKLLYAEHRGSFGGSQATTESVSVCWV